MTHTPDPQATVAAAPPDIREVVARAIQSSRHDITMNILQRDLVAADAAIRALVGLAGDEVTALVTDFGNKTWRYGVQDQVNAVRKTDDSLERFERYKAESIAAETALLAAIASIQARVPVVAEDCIVIPRSLAGELEEAAEWYSSRDDASFEDYIAHQTLREIMCAAEITEIVDAKEAARDES